MNPVVLELDFPIREGGNVQGEYHGFIDVLRRELADHPQRENYIDQYGGLHPLLPVQRNPYQPARWIHINLIVQNEDGVENTRTTIAVRDDNLYFKGFRNRHGEWYELGTDERDVPFIAGSTFLGCGVGYGDLVRGSAELVNLKLNKYDAIRAIGWLSEYRQAGGAVADDETRHHVARLCVIICECARMITPYNKVEFHWNSNDESSITRDHAASIKDWSKMSSELLRDPNRRNNRYFDVVHLLLNTRASILQQHGHEEQAAGGGGGGGSSQKGKGSSKTQRSSSWGTRLWGTTSSGGGSGAQEQKGQTGGKSVRTKPLAQVLSVEIWFTDRSPVGTIIVVFDGKRGQIISDGSKVGIRRPFSGYELALTGPYKAISAEGCFAVQAYDTTSGSDSINESSKVIGEIFWDCYADNVKYDEVVIDDIISTENIDHLVEVAYAVWSDAVELTVEVKLLPGITHVKGEITARYPLLGGRQVVLFRPEPDKHVELIPSSADSMVLLELQTSVIAVPVLSRYSRVTISLELSTVTPNKNVDFHFGSLDIFLDKHTGEIRATQHGAFFLPMGWAGVPDKLELGSAASHGSKGDSTSGSTQGSEQTVVQQGVLQVNISSPGFHLSPLKPTPEHMGLGRVF